MPSSSAQLLLAVARQREVPVAYVTGLQMRRAAELYAGTAKTDPRDAKVLAEFARRHADQLAWLDVTDELLAKLRILNGRDVDLAEDANRATNRCRDALVSISPALERALGARLGHAGVRDLLAAYPTPTALRATSADTIRATIAARSPRLADKITTAVTDALAAQTVTLPGEDTWGEIITGLVTDLDRLHTERAALGKQIETVFLKHPLGQVLVTLCGFGPRTAHEPSPRSATRPASPTAPASPRTPASPPSTGAPAARSTTPPRHAAGTTDSRTRCSSPSSSPSNTTPTPAPTTSASAPKARSTTPPSSASPAADATSSGPCSPATRPTTPTGTISRSPLDNKTGTPPQAICVTGSRSPTRTAEHEP
jgi:hypothetical protein